MQDESSTTTRVCRCLDRLRAGDPLAREQLLIESDGRMRRLARRMLRGSPHVRCWEETDDLLQQARLRLYRSLESVQINGPSHFFALAATGIRRELIDLARKHFGPAGAGKLNARNQKIETVNSASRQSGPHTLAEWTEFHVAVGGLPSPEKEVFCLKWYNGLTFPEIGELLGLSERTAKRRWKDAGVRLYKHVRGESGDI